MQLLGVDTGGTFTDFVLYDGDRLRVHKVLSTPVAPEQAILQGIRELGLQPAGLTLVHGSTVATNAALEGKGVRTVYIGNHGLGDLLTLGRQARERLYDLQPPKVPPPVPSDLCLETGGRLGADGSVVEPLTDAELTSLVEQVRTLAPRAVAINLLFSFLDPSFEQRIESALRAALPDLFISRSSAVLAEYREYERGIATWLNAWVGPLVEGYLRRLAEGLPGARISVMQSSGNTIAADQAGRAAVEMLLSGPAGGLAGARYVAAHSGCERLLTFDMGGTSTDVALLDGELLLTSEGRIGRWPVAVPQVDMHTIGAGGGSIAYVDAGGMLQVGPESAGADPGPACYGRGGTRPTVTDANLLLGRLRADAFLGGGMALDVAAAERAMDGLAADLGVSRLEAAEGVIALANERMAAALRVMSVQRGVDPRELVLTCFGGAGGLHVCALAEALGMTRALVPVHAGVLSALGMLAAPRGRQRSRTLGVPLAEQGDEALEAQLAELAAEGRAALIEEGVAAGAIVAEYSLDLRYHGQSYTLNLPWSGIAASGAAFHARHRARYGHDLALPVELVNLRVAVRGPRPQLQLGGDVVASGTPLTGRVVQREALPLGVWVDGERVITEQVSTTWLAPGWRVRREAVGNLLLAREG